MAYPPATRPSASWVADLDDVGIRMPDGANPAMIGAAVAVATELLWMKSGRHLDTPTTTIRPCKGNWLNQFLPAAVIAALLPPIGPGWGFLNGYGGSGLLFPSFSWLGTCDHVDGCACQFIDRVELRPYPVRSVAHVKIDGTDHPALDSEGSFGDVWRLVNYRTLIRTDGELWPVCQDITQDDTHEGTWSVTFQHGHPPGKAAQRACGEMAMELVKGSMNLPCNLPRRTTTVSRQGVSIAMFDPEALAKENKTGLYFVDLWLSAVNPAGLMRPSRVFRADDTRGRAVRE